MMRMLQLGNLVTQLKRSMRLLRHGNLMVSVPRNDGGLGVKRGRSWGGRSPPQLLPYSNTSPSLRGSSNGHWNDRSNPD
jgi:hypothetical protein